MKKVLLATAIVLCFSVTSFAQEYEPKQKTGVDIYLLLTAGVLIPDNTGVSVGGVSVANSVFAAPYAPSFAGGLTAGFQINRGFAIDLSFLYQNIAWNSDKYNIYKGFANLNAFDFKFYTLWQPVINVNKNVKILPFIGPGVMFSYSNDYGFTDMFGIGAKIGVRATYKMFMGGIGVEYAFKGGLTGGTSIMFEAGVIFD